MQAQQESLSAAQIIQLVQAMNPSTQAGGELPEAVKNILNPPAPEKPKNTLTVRINRNRLFITRNGVKTGALTNAQLVSISPDVKVDGFDVEDYDMLRGLSVTLQVGDIEEVMEMESYIKTAPQKFELVVDDVELSTQQFTQPLADQPNNWQPVYITADSTDPQIIQPFEEGTFLTHTVTQEPMMVPVLQVPVLSVWGHTVTSVIPPDSYILSLSREEKQAFLKEAVRKQARLQQIGVMGWQQRQRAAMSMAQQAMTEGSEMETPVATPAS